MFFSVSSWESNDTTDLLMCGHFRGHFKVILSLYIINPYFLFRNYILRKKMHNICSKHFFVILYNFLQFFVIFCNVLQFFVIFVTLELILCLVESDSRVRADRVQSWKTDTIRIDITLQRRFYIRPCRPYLIGYASDVRDASRSRTAKQVKTGGHFWFVVAVDMQTNKKYFDTI